MSGQATSSDAAGQYFETTTISGNGAVWGWTVSTLMASSWPQPLFRRRQEPTLSEAEGISRESPPRWLSKQARFPSPPRFVPLV